MADSSSRLRDLSDESDDLLSEFYYRMLKLREPRLEQNVLDMLRRSRAALETRSYKDAVRQVQSFGRVAREAIQSSTDAATAFKTVEKSVERLRLFAEQGVEMPS